MTTHQVSRELLLQQLESVSAGLSSREVIEQSSCFIFRDKEVMTYNDEIATRQPCCLDIEGAVQAEPLLAILRKLNEDQISITAADGELLIEGKRRKAGIRMEQEILLPVDRVEQPEQWKELPDDFNEAVQIVIQCAGNDESQFRLTCVHLTPEHLETTSNTQMSRYYIKTDLADATLVRRDSIKHVVEFGMVDFSETENWLHFSNPTGLVLSCRRYVEEANNFPDLGPLIEFDGVPTELPTGLTDAVEKAEVFSSENAASNQVTVQLKATGKLRIRGEGNFGWFTEVKALKYNGEDLSFRIAPKLLVDLVSRHNECEISTDRLKVNGGEFVYVTALDIVGAE